MKFAVTIDNQASESIPTEPKGEGKEKYYQVTASCDDGIKAEWDYNAWNLKVEDITKGTKCKLAFNSTLTEEDYKEYIDAGVAYRRNTYRGKDITSKLEDGSLFSEIKSGHFDDIFVGDYIVDNKSDKKDMYNQPIRYLVADLDNYLNTGSSNILTKHHATIIPATSLTTAQMNSTSTTIGGYAGSEMVGYVVGEDGKATQDKKEDGGTLDTILNTYINPDFGTSNPSNDNTDHIIEYENTITDSVSDQSINKSGNSTGASSNRTWYTRKLDLMSEMNVYGGIVWSSSGYDIGIDYRQYAIFKLKPEFINSYGTTRFHYWLKDVTSTSYFARVGGGGDTMFNNATSLLGVRPRFLID